MKIQIIIPVYKPDNKLLMFIKTNKKQMNKKYSIINYRSGSNDEYRDEIEDMNCLVKK